MSYKVMRLLCMFDLPVDTADEKELTVRSGQS